MAKEIKKTGTKGTPKILKDKPGKVVKSGVDFAAKDSYCQSALIINGDIYKSGDRIDTSKYPAPQIKNLIHSGVIK